MSWQATSWALREAPAVTPYARLVLIALADRARPDGSRCWARLEVLADEAHCSRRTVVSALHSLEECGAIVRGDQSLARFDEHGRYLVPQHRPVVWNLNMGVRLEPVAETVPGTTGSSPGGRPPVKKNPDIVPVTGDLEEGPDTNRMGALSSTDDRSEDNNPHPSVEFGDATVASLGKGGIIPDGRGAKVAPLDSGGATGCTARGAKCCTARGAKCCTARGAKCCTAIRKHKNNIIPLSPFGGIPPQGDTHPHPQSHSSAATASPDDHLAPIAEAPSSVNPDTGQPASLADPGDSVSPVASSPHPPTPADPSSAATLPSHQPELADRVEGVIIFHRHQLETAGVVIAGVDMARRRAARERQAAIRLVDVYGVETVQRIICFAMTHDFWVSKALTLRSLLLVAEQIRVEMNRQEARHSHYRLQDAPNVPVVVHRHSYACTHTLTALGRSEAQLDYLSVRVAQLLNEHHDPLQAVDMARQEIRDKHTHEKSLECNRHHLHTLRSTGWTGYQYAHQPQHPLINQRNHNHQEATIMKGTE